MALAVLKKVAEKRPRRRAVGTATAKLRALILEREAGARIGSLNEVAELLGVGVVTVQQTARVLEHEGLLVVRRGPGGGYYGTRPDEETLERSIAAYMRAHGSGRREAVEVLTLLKCEISALATHCTDAGLREALSVMILRVDRCATRDDRIIFDQHQHELLSKMAARPLTSLITQVAWRLYNMDAVRALYPGNQRLSAWKANKRRLLCAILDQDYQLARFEASRERDEVLACLLPAEHDMA